MKRAKGARQIVNETWIPESRSFFEDVIQNTISNLQENSANLKERKMLAKLRTNWMENYKASERMPEHLPEADRVAPPKRKPRPRTTAKATAAKSTPKANEVYVDANIFDDEKVIDYRINIPPLRPNWECRSFDLKVKAKVCKENLIQPLINWKLLDNIMSVPIEEGTVIFQNYVDEMLPSEEN